MKVWKINVNGEDHEVVFTPNQWSGKHMLTTDGENMNFKRCEIL